MLFKRFFSSAIRYTKTHEYIKPIGHNIGRVGISKYASEKLVNIIFVEFPSDNIIAVDKNTPIVFLESVKSASEVLSPVNGIIHNVNYSLITHDYITKINDDPLNIGWLFDIKYKNNDLTDLMTQAEYDKYIDNIKNKLYK